MYGNVVGCRDAALSTQALLLSCPALHASIPLTMLSRLRTLEGARETERTTMTMMQLHRTLGNVVGKESCTVKVNAAANYKSHKNPVSGGSREFLSSFREQFPILSLGLELYTLGCCLPVCVPNHSAGGQSWKDLQDV